MGSAGPPTTLDVELAGPSAEPPTGQDMELASAVEPTGHVGLESAGPQTGHEGLEWAEPLTKNGGLASAGEPVLEQKLKPEPWLLGHGLESWPCVS